MGTNVPHSDGSIACYRMRNILKNKSDFHISLCNCIGQNSLPIPKILAAIPIQTFFEINCFFAKKTFYLTLLTLN